MKALLLLASLVFSITSCASFCGEKVSYAVHADKRLNPDIYNHSSPLVIAVYQLSSTSSFKKMSIESFLQEEGKISAGIISKQEIIIRPNQNIEYGEKIYPETNYIVIIPEFRSAKLNKEKCIIELKKVHPSRVELHLEANTMVLNTL